MTTHETIKNFLLAQDDISLGYSEINFFNPDSFEKEQVGYSFDAKGKSLVSGKKGHWQSNWTVIATDEAGDPILVDTATPELLVLTAPHGMGSWDPQPIAESLESFTKILDRLRTLAIGRENPVAKELNPLSAQEADAFLKYAAAVSPNTDTDHWLILMQLTLEGDTD